MRPILLLLLTISSFTSWAQASFPAAWQGQWVGNLEIFTAGGKAQEIPMELHILPFDGSANHSFNIIYGEDKEAGKRPYELVTLDAAKGLYLIDEKNSIKMEAYLIGGKLIQWFEVEGSMLYTTTELVGETLHWEIVAGSSVPVSTTGGTHINGEDIAPVKTFPVNVLQIAELKRKP